MKISKSIILLQFCVLMLVASCSPADNGSTNTSEPYKGEKFVGTWQATVEDGEVFYFKLNADASFAERYSRWENFVYDYDRYTVNGNRITLPNCGFAQGYGTTFTMEFVNNNKMIWDGDFHDYRVELVRQ